jgi:hypothetical protein
MAAATKAKVAAAMIGVAIVLISAAGIMIISLSDGRGSAVDVVEEPLPAAPMSRQLELNVSFEQLDLDPSAEPPVVRLHYPHPVRPEGPLPPAGDVALLSPGANRVDLSAFPDGSHYVYIVADGFAPQWIRVEIGHGEVVSGSAEVELYRSRYVIVRFAVNTSGGRELEGPDVREGRVAVTHFGGFDAFGHDWQVRQAQAGGGGFGPVAYLSFHRVIGGYGFLEAPPEAEFEDLTVAPLGASYTTESLEAYPGLLLVCRINGDRRPPDEMGYGKVLVEEVTLERPVDVPIVERRY